MIEFLCRAGWAPALVFLLHVFLARVVGAYETWPSIDIPMHVAGGVAIAFFFARWAAMRVVPAIEPRQRKQIHAMVVFALTATATVFWEFGEFLSDRFLGGRAQGGLPDTLLDMFLGIAGGGGFIAAAYRTSLLGEVLRLRYVAGRRPPDLPA